MGESPKPPADLARLQSAFGRSISTPLKVLDDDGNFALQTQAYDAGYGFGSSRQGSGTWLCNHSMFSSVPDSKASMASCRSSSVRAADICVRMRALPLGTETVRCTLPCLFTVVGSANHPRP